MPQPTEPTEPQVHQALALILSDTRSLNTSLNWAVNYVRSASSMQGEALRVQCLYVLNNIQAWRHPSAKSVRTTLKAFTKGKPTKGAPTS